MFKRGRIHLIDDECGPLIWPRISELCNSPDSGGAASNGPTIEKRSRAQRSRSRGSRRITMETPVDCGETCRRLVGSRSLQGASSLGYHQLLRERIGVSAPLAQRAQRRQEAQALDQWCRPLITGETRQQTRGQKIGGNGWHEDTAGAAPERRMNKLPQPPAAPPLQGAQRHVQHQGQLLGPLMRDTGAHGTAQNNNGCQIDTPAQIAHGNRGGPTTTPGAAEAMAGIVRWGQPWRRAPRLPGITRTMQRTATTAPGATDFGGLFFIDVRQQHVQLGVLQKGMAHFEGLCGLGGLWRLSLGDRLVKIPEGDLPHGPHAIRSETSRTPSNNLLTLTQRTARLPTRRSAMVNVLEKPRQGRYRV